MTQYQLTLDSETLQRLFGENEQVARMLEAVVNQVLEAQAAEHLQAAPYERTQEAGTSWIPQWVQAAAAHHAGRDAQLARAPGPRRLLLVGPVRALPTQ
jgi:hypothetical protein